jgi:non-specific serine/threonine protein kinase/serine/threonine-protein kinase
VSAEEEHPAPDANSSPHEGDTTVTSPIDFAGTGGPLIDRYQLLQKIGEGGMGEVWLAEQKEPVRRRVALKLVKAGMNSREVVARFESERQALALMDHSAIAKVLDAGSTPQGAPYFVMEYVAGVPITDYCDNHRLSTRDRLELFMQVCEGVQHAHQKAIIHRDLKPSNILVTEVDGRPAPKIIDFGVAKALTQKLTANTMFTRVGALVGTPEYMSPEQALSSGEDLDTRTDVYSLGIVFYELLAGAPPIELRKIALDEFLRRLRDEDPPRPSARIRTQDPATSTELARRRRSEAPALARQLQGDLDSIALKALEKDRARRFGSPSDFAADIARYLKNEAVLAVPASTAYRARKFARRNRAALVTACAFALVLIAAAAISIRQSIRANREAAMAQAVNDFLQNDVLAQASAFNQGMKPDPNLTVRTALDRAAAKIAGKFTYQPLVEASIRHTIGAAYIDLSVYPDAEMEFERALALRREHLGENNPTTISSMGSLAAVYERQGKLTEAEPLYAKVLEANRRLVGEESPATLKSMTGLAVTYAGEGKFDQAEKLLSRALPLEEKVLGKNDLQTLRTMGNLGSIYYYQHKYQQSNDLLLKTLEAKRRALGEDNPETLDTETNLAGNYVDRGDYAEAEPLYSAALAGFRRVLGEAHHHTINAMNCMADLYRYRGDLPRAEALFSQALEAARRGLGDSHPATLESMAGLAEIYAAQSHYEQAERLFSTVLESRRRMQGPEQPEVLGTALYLASVRLNRHEYATAESELHDSLKIFEKIAPNAFERYWCQALLGAALAGGKKYAEAEPLLTAGYDGMVKAQDNVPVGDRLAIDDIAQRASRLYEDWGKPDKAREWKQKPRVPALVGVK